MFEIAPIIFLFLIPAITMRTFSEENQKMLQLVSIINDTCLYGMDGEIHEMLLEGIIEQCQMRILTGKEYQKYLIYMVKKIKEM